MSPADLIGTLKDSWNTLSKDSKNMILKAVDNYLKFKDQAEFVLLTSYHALTLSYLDAFKSYREGKHDDSISSLHKISEEAKEAEFEGLSEEATQSATDFESTSEKLSTPHKDVEIDEENSNQEENNHE